jgi:hypothetical protein
MIELFENCDLSKYQVKRVLAALFFVYLRGGAWTAGAAETTRELWAAEDVGLGTFAQTCFGEFFDGKFVAFLVDGEMHGAKGAATDFMLQRVPGRVR